MLMGGLRHWVKPPKGRSHSWYRMTFYNTKLNRTFMDHKRQLKLAIVIRRKLTKRSS